MSNLDRRALGALLLAGLGAGLLGACAAPVRPVSIELVVQKLGFLRDGETTRREVLDRMGEPRENFEADAMLTYLLFENELGNFSVGTPPARGAVRGEYTLVLVFDAQEVLRKHSLVHRK